MRKVLNTHLVSYSDFVEEKKLFYLVMNIGNWDNMAKFIAERNNKRLKERIILDIACQLLIGLSYMHNLKLLHTNIGLTNIFILGNVVKLGDLSLTRYNLQVPI